MLPSMHIKIINNGWRIDYIQLQDEVRYLGNLHLNESTIITHFNGNNFIVSYLSDIMRTTFLEEERLRC